VSTVTSPPSASTFERVRRTRVYEEVASQIQQQIAQGRYRPGDKLPAERELAEAFGVSRASVRDAIRVLELAGLVTPKQGEGTVVRQLTIDTVVSPLASVLLQRRELLGDLLDARKIIEPPVAYRAAQHATSQDIEAMREILELQGVKVAAGQPAIDEDSAFHYRLATAARNEVILKVLDVLMDLLREGRERSLQVRGRPQRSLDGHRRILAAIERRDAEGARAAMDEHLEEIREILQTVTAKGGV
jgi:GntR family transcriptional repressor for pyruvate dehydrogenase complex